MLLIFRRKSYRRKRDNFAKYIKASAAAGAMTPEAWSAAPALVYRKVTSKRGGAVESEKAPEILRSVLLQCFRSLDAQQCHQE